MTDAAERWLRDNDPDYTKSRYAWKHIGENGYERPWQEVLWDDPGREPDNPVVVESRLCEGCWTEFAPTLSWNRYCSERCRERLKKRRHRDRQ